MTRDETVALFLECEARRIRAHDAAVAEGKSEDQARNIAHEAAKAHWNAWARKLLAERKAMENERWAESEADWSKRAEANFSQCLFVTKGRGSRRFESEKLETDWQPAKSIPIYGAVVDLRGFDFPGYADFYRTIFSGDARFESTAFLGEASFDSATFLGDAWFDGAAFSHDAWFYKGAFNGLASFRRGVAFQRDAGFATVHFDQSASFQGARFGGEANFAAVRCEQGFSIADAVFKNVPDFIQAHFAEAPRLDNLQVAPTRRSNLVTEDARRDHLSCWRALKRLAIEAHDIDRELEFSAQEISAARSSSNWPIPVRLFEGRKWLEASRSLSSYFYWAFSDYGRSVLRPMGWWLLTIVVATSYYLGQHESVATNRARLHEQEGYSATGAFVRSELDALKRDQACFYREPLRKPIDDKALPLMQRIGLIDDIAKETNAPWEALQLAFRNGALVLDGGSEAAHRTYGCLYGFELFGTSRTVYAPPAVSIVSAIQKLFSAVFIFLFGLALRNMLKVK
jgi:hypothetical protein